MIDRRAKYRALVEPGGRGPERALASGRREVPGGSDWGQDAETRTRMRSVIKSGDHHADRLHRALTKIREAERRAPALARSLREETWERILAKQQRKLLRTTREVAAGAPAFHFGAADRARLEHLLGGGPVIERLEGAVTTCLRDPESYEPALKYNVRLRVVAAARARERLLTALEALPPDFGTSTWLSPFGAACGCWAWSWRVSNAGVIGMGTRRHDRSCASKAEFRRALVECGLLPSHHGKTDEAYRIVYRAVTGREPGRQQNR